MVRVSLRTVTLRIPPQEVITRDNVPGARGGGRLLPRDRPEPLGARDRGLPRRDAPDRPDDAALGARQGRARRAAGRARAPQREPPADHRRADRAVGDQGHDRRDQGRGDPRAHAARDRPPGGGRAQPARQGDQRRGRVPGRRPAGRGRRRDPARTRSRSSCATSRRCRTSAPTRPRRSSSRCRSTCCARCWSQDASRPRTARCRTDRLRAACEPRSSGTWSGSSSGAWTTCPRPARSCT